MSFRQFGVVYSNNVAHRLKSASKLANVFNSSSMHRSDRTRSRQSLATEITVFYRWCGYRTRVLGKHVDVVGAAIHLRRAYFQEFQQGVLQAASRTYRSNSCVAAKAAGATAS
jgi:hypothetical protein